MLVRSIVCTSLFLLLGVSASAGLKNRSHFKRPGKSQFTQPFIHAQGNRAGRQSSIPETRRYEKKIVNGDHSKMSVTRRLKRTNKRIAKRQQDALLAYLAKSPKVSALDAILDRQIGMPIIKIASLPTLEHGVVDVFFLNRSRKLSVVKQTSRPGSLQRDSLKLETLLSDKTNGDTAKLLKAGIGHIVSRHSSVMK